MTKKKCVSIFVNWTNLWWQKLWMHTLKQNSISKHIKIMDGLEDFLLFNACEDAREEQEAHATTEYPYQSSSGKK